MTEEKKEFNADPLSNLPILSPGNIKFATLIASGAPLAEAYREAFPEKSSSKYIAVYATRLVRNPKVREYIDIIQQATRLQFIMETPQAFERMKQLSESAESEKVKLEATKDILDRGGLKPPERVESIHVGIFGSASTQDIKTLIRGKILEENNAL